jgi:hypothetical protein
MVCLPIFVGMRPLSSHHRARFAFIGILELREALPLSVLFMCTHLARLFPILGDGSFNQESNGMGIKMLKPFGNESLFTWFLLR